MSQHCFEAFFNISEEMFNTIMNCIIWAFKHNEAEIQVIGLETLRIVLENLNRYDNFRDRFYQIYLDTLLNEILYIFTDGLHKNSFEKIAETLRTFLMVAQNLKY